MDRDPRRRAPAWSAHRLLQQILDELFELRPGQLHLQMLGAGLVGRDERQIDVGLDDGGELHLGLLSGSFSRCSAMRFCQVDALGLL